MNLPLLSTYRLQLHKGFTFRDAAAIVPYLAALGVTHVYCSPYLQAAPGSTHGYDVVDHRRLNEELGGEREFQNFVLALQRSGLGQVVDIVPNHMAISGQNFWWQDVLENGVASPFAAYFDVDWAPPEVRLHNAILIPVLEDQYGRVLEDGKIVLERLGPFFRIRYHEHSYPVSPRSLGSLLSAAANPARSNALAYLADAFSALPHPTALDRESVRRRQRDTGVLRQYLEHGIRHEPGCAEALDQIVARYNRQPDLLHDLLEAQNYRLAWWRTAGRDLGYRRFFDVNSLIGLRSEDPQVFEDTHRRILELVENGIVSGLRIDHIDGLRDPQQYLDRLRKAAPEAWIVVEKVLEAGEQLPQTWPVAGTTGYDFLNLVGGLFVDPGGEEPLTVFYAEFTGESAGYARTAYERKMFVLREVLGSDVNRLANLLLEICERHRRHRDYSRHQLTDALREVIARFPVYRTYVRARADITAADRRYIEEATRSAIEERPELDAPLFEFIQRLLLLQVSGDQEAEFAARFQQLTGPAMAKGVEDTTFYTYNRFVARNEVGGDPGRFAVSVEDFHHALSEAGRLWPRTMTTTDTHDAKRSEDVRMRLAILSECPRQWCGAVRRWSDAAAKYRTGSFPDRNTEYFFYQTLVGAWPLERDRALSYMEKAIREAKRLTSWTSPDPAYEEAVRRFVECCLQDGQFMADVGSFAGMLEESFRINSLAQIAIKLTAPGVPDTYQGTELRTLRLVDPDNRRPVDYQDRKRILDRLEGGAPPVDWKDDAAGETKLWLIRNALHLRKRHPDAFGPDGIYTPLYADGPEAQHVVAFARGTVAVTVVPRLRFQRGLPAATALDLPPGSWRDVMTGRSWAGRVSLPELWKELPIALLERAGSVATARV